MAVKGLSQKLLSAFLFTNMLKRYKNKTFLMKIKVARGYIIGVKKTRLLSVGILFVFLALTFLISGLFLIQAALFTYSAWSNVMKFNIALILGVLEFTAALSVLFYLFREETWVKFSGMENVIKAIVENEGDRHETKASEKECA